MMILSSSELNKHRYNAYIQYWSIRYNGKLYHATSSKMCVKDTTKEPLIQHKYIIKDFEGLKNLHKEIRSLPANFYTKTRWNPEKMVFYTQSSMKPITAKNFKGTFELEIRECAFNEVTYEDIIYWNIEDLEKFKKERV